MSQARDLFFDEFYSELEDIVQGIQGWEEEAGAPSGKLGPRTPSSLSTM